MVIFEHSDVANGEGQIDKEEFFKQIDYIVRTIKEDNKDILEKEASHDGQERSNNH